jgi:hypothetical protein
MDQAFRIPMNKINAKGMSRGAVFSASGVAIRRLHALDLSAL